MSYFKLKEVDIPIYRGTLVIIFTDDPEKLKKEIDDNSFSIPASIYCHAMYAEKDERHGFIAIFNFKNKGRPVTHGAIAHEAVHIANFMFDSRGMVPDQKNDEAFSYFTEWVVDQVYTFAKECKFKPTVI
jgi:hypothetical protein